MVPAVKDTVVIDQFLVGPGHWIGELENRLSRQDDPAPVDPRILPLFFEMDRFALRYIPVIHVQEVTLGNAENRLPHSRLGRSVDLLDLEGVALVDEFRGEQLLDLESETTGDAEQRFE